MTSTTRCAARFCLVLHIDDAQRARTCLVKMLDRDEARFALIQAAPHRGEVVIQSLGGP